MNSVKGDIEIIERFIKGEVSDAEREYVEKLFLNGEHNPALIRCLENDWNLTPKENTIQTTDLNRLLDSIHHEIRKKEFQKKQRISKKIIRIYTRAAAILLLPLLLTGVIVYSLIFRNNASQLTENVTSEIYAPLGSRIIFNLPDGTNGVLNGGSRLKYSLPFIKRRQVSIEGEAWFDVHHDTTHPFFVNAGRSSIKVTGTSFNVSAYPSDNFVEVVLQTGEVKFIRKKADREVTMFPSERLVLRNGEIHKNIVDPEKYKGWTEGKLIFRSDPMNEVARRIERWYNVKITLADAGLEKYSFRATFQDDKLEDVIKYLAMTSPITYKILPRKLLPDGTYRKKEVIIYRNK